MGKIQEDKIFSERVCAARQRAETTLRRQGRKPVTFDALLAQGSPADDPGDEFLAELRHWRSEGEPPQ